MTTSSNTSKWKKEWTAPTVIVAVLGLGLTAWFGAQAHHDTTLPVSTPITLPDSTVGGTQTASPSGAGAANNQANGEGSSVNSNNTTINVPQLNALLPKLPAPHHSHASVKVFINPGGHAHISLKYSDGDSLDADFQASLPAKPLIKPTPKQKVVYINFIIAYDNLDKGNLQTSINNFQKIVAERPDDAKAYNNLAIAQFANNQYQDAFISWQRAIFYDPANSSYRENFENGLEAFHQILRRRPHVLNEGATIVLANLFGLTSNPNISPSMFMIRNLSPEPLKNVHWGQVMLYKSSSNPTVIWHETVLPTLADNGILDFPSRYGDSVSIDPSTMVELDIIINADGPPGIGRESMGAGFIPAQRSDGTWAWLPKWGTMQLIQRSTASP